jgi:CHAT domain-containing protein
MHRIPFALLRLSSDRYLIDDYILSVAPSAGLLLAQRSVDTSQLNRFVGIGAPDVIEWPYLSSAERELVNVSGLFADRRTFIGAEATKAAFFKHAPDADLLLLSTHAEYVAEDPFLSYIVLAGDRRASDRLTAREIFQTDLSGAVVLLNCCSTGLSGSLVDRKAAGDETFGLPQAMLAAGSSCVIASLWPLDDESAAKMSMEFYQQLIQHKGSPADAWRRAILSIRDKFPDIPESAWGAYLVYGG